MNAVDRAKRVHDTVYALEFSKLYREDRPIKVADEMAEHAARAAFDSFMQCARRHPAKPR